MLTPEQEKWIDSLSDRPVTIVPYDERSERLFNEVRSEIYGLLGRDIEVEHEGSSALGISGQDEIDVSIAVSKDKIEEYIPKLETVFGPVRKRYEDRARFEVRREEKKIDLKIVDMNNQNSLEAKLFKEYMLNHPEDLERYRVLKEESHGQTTKEYYRRKIEFINDILAKINTQSSSRK